MQWHYGRRSNGFIPLQMRSRDLSRQRPNALCGKRRSAKSLNGFTLLEVMIAIGILAIGLIVLLQTHVMNLKMIAHSQLSMKAMLLAERRIAEIEAGGVKTIGETEGDFEEFPEFYWREVVTPFSIGSEVSGGVSRVEVIVSWEEGQREEEVKLVTYLLQ